MIEFLNQVSELVIWTAVAGVLVAVAVYALGRLRGESAQQEPPASQLLAKCREMHARGELGDAEFRTIKSKLEGRLRNEPTDSRQTS